MFCDGCGTAVQPGQTFCSKCGKQILGRIAPQPLPGRVQRHVHLLAILWLAFSAFNTLGGLVLLVLGNALFPHLHEMKDVPPDVPAGFLTALFTTLGIIVLAKAVFGFLVGWGLLQREPWARMLALILAFISLFTNIPLGTAIGVYTMWVLLPAWSEQEYEALVEARSA
jgi:amino acid transporter